MTALILALAIASALTTSTLAVLIVRASRVTRRKGF